MTERQGGVDLDVLTREFPKSAHKQRQQFTYVQGHVYIHRLNAATGNNWDFNVLDIDFKPITGQGGVIVGQLATAKVRLCLPGLGCREHIGVQAVHDRGGEDLVKGCVTDGLKKAASLFGVGLELYGDDFEGDAHETHQNGAGEAKGIPPTSGAKSSPLPRGGASEAQEEANPYELSGASEKQVNYAKSLARERGFKVVGPDGEEHTDVDRLLATYPGKDAGDIIDEFVSTAKRAAKWPEWRRLPKDATPDMIGDMVEVYDDRLVAALSLAELEGIGQLIGFDGIKDEELRARYKDLRARMKESARIAAGV